MSHADYAFIPDHKGLEGRAGGSGKNGRLMIDAPREMNISRSNNDPNPEKRKDTYYPEPRISEEAQHEIKKIIWNERQKKAKPAKADKKA